MRMRILALIVLTGLRLAAEVASPSFAFLADGRVTLGFDAVPGPVARFGAVDIVGTHTGSRRLVERQLTFQPGAPYRDSLLRESQRRLYATELFQFVNVEPVEISAIAG